MRGRFPVVYPTGPSGEGSAQSEPSSLILHLSSLRSTARQRALMNNQSTTLTICFANLTSLHACTCDCKRLTRQLLAPACTSGSARNCARRVVSVSRERIGAAVRNHPSFPELCKTILITCPDSLTGLVRLIPKRGAGQVIIFDLPPRSLMTWPRTARHSTSRLFSTRTIRHCISTWSRCSSCKSSVFHNSSRVRSARDFLRCSRNLTGGASGFSESCAPVGSGSAGRQLDHVSRATWPHGDATL